jgi:nanoRNase/pAp phosphatase (c-di-AMP/oligoRNAs hydrolase)
MESGRAPDQSPPLAPADLERLCAAAGAGPVLILTHDNPDPDALASGKALAVLLKQAWGVNSRLVFSGLVARAENQVMLHRLTPEWVNEDELTGLDQYSAVALVDTQPGAGNNRWPTDHVPAIVIDHHQPLREQIAAVPYADVRYGLGACVTMLSEYLDLAGLEPDGILATAMFYGLKTDTRGLSRGTSAQDEQTYLKLLAKVSRPQLVQVEQAGLSPDHFRAFSRGLRDTMLYGQAAVARLTEMHQLDLAAEMADLLIRLDGAQAVLCMGPFGDTLHVSLRTKPMTETAGQLIQQIVLPPGKAGGHRSMAGGQVPIDGRVPAAVMDEIETLFLTVMGETPPGERLIPG